MIKPQKSHDFIFKAGMIILTDEPRSSVVKVHDFTNLRLKVDREILRDQATHQNTPILIRERIK